MTKRWTQRPEGSNWGDFGDDDQLGSLNYITPGRVKAAVQTVEYGLRFCLSLPLDYPGGNALAPHRLPPVLEPTARAGKPYFNYRFREEHDHLCDVACDDRVTLSTQYSTQWDSLAHIGYELDIDGEKRLSFYNGYVGGVDILPPEERRLDYRMALSIDAFAATPIQGRGVLIDIEKHLGRDKRDIVFNDIEAILRADNVTIEEGDIICLHTGFADEVLKMERKPDAARLHGICAALDGRDKALRDWLTDTRVSAIVSDNYAIERVGLPMEGPDAVFVPLHHHCLYKRGIPMGELWHLTELANWLREHDRSTFLLTAPPLRLPGAVGSPVTPVATV